MNPDPPTPPEPTGLVLQRGAGLAPLTNGNSPALSEIITRSLQSLKPRMCCRQVKFFVLRLASCRLAVLCLRRSLPRPPPHQPVARHAPPETRLGVRVRNRPWRDDEDVLDPTGGVSHGHSTGVSTAPKNILRGCRSSANLPRMKTIAKTTTGKRGRPPGAATKRINTRFPAGLAEKIEYAAAVRGMAVSAFIHEAVAARADQVIEAESRWLLTRDEAANLAAMIADPPKPNKRMLDAAKLAARHVVIRD